jgi:hypothetical protein
MMRKPLQVRLLLANLPCNPQTVEPIAAGSAMEGERDSLVRLFILGLGAYL